MAVYEGARPRSILLPRSRPKLVEAPTLPRRRMRGAVRARRRSSRLSFVLGGIVLAFMLAFFSLAQSVRVAATGYDINDLLEQQQELIVRKQELLSDLNRRAAEPAIRKLSIDAGLGQLVEPLVLTER
jgi:Tfp pilus assembly protein PilN